jgi:type III restriction enzyme
MSNLRRITRLARLLVQDGVHAAAQEEMVGKLVDVLEDHLANRLSEDAAFENRLHSLETITYSSVILHSGEMRVEKGSARTVAVTARDVEMLFSKAKSVLTDEVAMAFWRRRYNQDDPYRAKLEAYELALDEGLGRAIERKAGSLLSDLFGSHRGAINALGPERRALYNALHAIARHEEAGQMDIPETIVIDLSPDAAPLPDHMFIDDDGEFRATLNGWEGPVLDEERQKRDFLTWIRNFDRKPWALAFPYTLNARRAPGYPDFIVVRGSVEQPVFDILEPHRGEDSVAKAKGLSEFADRHGATFGRIELIRIDQGRIRRLNLNDHRLRAEVMPIQSQDELLRLFDRHGTGPQG